MLISSYAVFARSSLSHIFCTFRCIQIQTYSRKLIMDLTQYHCAPERSLIIVTILYTTALTVSTSVQNALMQKSTCDPLIPFGECLVGEYEGRRRLYSNTTYLQYSISFIVVLLAGMYEFNKIIKNG